MPTNDSLWGPITDRIHRLEEESGALVRLEFLQGIPASTQVVHRHSRGLKLGNGLLLVLVLLLAFRGRDGKTALSLRGSGRLGGSFPVQTREQLDLRSGRSARNGACGGAGLQDPLSDRLNPDHRRRGGFGYRCWWQLDRDLRRRLLASSEDQIGQLQNSPTGLLISVAGPGVEDQNPEGSHRGDHPQKQWHEELSENVVFPHLLVLPQHLQHQFYVTLLVLPPVLRYRTVFFDQQGFSVLG